MDNTFPVETVLYENHAFSKTQCTHRHTVHTIDDTANDKEPALDRIHKCILNALVTPLWIRAATEVIKNDQGRVDK